MVKWIQVLEVKTNNTNPYGEASFQFEDFENLSLSLTLTVVSRVSELSSSSSGSLVAMGNEADNKFTWIIKSFSGFESSSDFMIGGCSWYLFALPKDSNSKCTTNYLSLYLGADRFKPCGWKRIHATYRLTLVNQLSEKLSLVKGKQHWFEQERPGLSYSDMIPFTKLYDKDGGFLVNNEIKIVVAIDVLEVIRNLDFSVESREEATQPLKKTKLNDDGDVSAHLHKEISSVKETIDVNGFQVFPSQAESVKRIFEKHQNMALNFRAKDQYLRTLCMNALLNLIQTLCQSLQDLCIDDLGQAYNTLTYLKNSGFKVDWLERKLEEVKAKKIEEEIGETRIQEFEKELKNFKKKYSDIEALLEKKKEELKDLKQKWSVTETLLKNEKAKVFAARVPPLTLDDLV